MYEWSEEQQMVRSAVRDFIDKEIRPHREELEFGDLPPYDLLRKMFATFGMTDMQRASFDDPRLDELFFRWRARNFADTLTPAEAERWTQLRTERLLHGGGGGLTVDAFHEKLRALAETADARGQVLLAALGDYARSITTA